MSLSLSEATDRTRLATDAAIPGVLAGLDSAASTPEGVRRIDSAVDKADESVIGSLSGMFGKGFPSESGVGTMRSIMGVEDYSDLAENIGTFSGMSGKSASSLIGMLTPLVFALLRKVSRTGSGLDVAGLLANQRAKIEAAMPPGFDENYEAPRARRRHRHGETYTEAETENRSLWRWILPLALMAGALGLIFQFAWQYRPAQEAFSPPTTVQAGGEGATPSLEQLKNKYRGVLREAEAQGVRINELLLRDGKLWIRGTAPSLEAANNVWAEIRRANPGLTEINADFTVANRSNSPR
jgi:hypothetical protein